MKIGRPFSCGCTFCASGKWLATNILTFGVSAPKFKHVKVFKL